MNIDTARTLIESSAIVAVMRGHFPPQIALAVAQTLLECDISIFRLTVNSEQPFEAMRALKREFGMNAAIGMGTVLDVDNAQRALDEGADFVVAPSFSREVVRLVLDAGVMMIPGVMTPSECVDAWALGVPLRSAVSGGRTGAGVLQIDHRPAVSHALHVQRRHQRQHHARLSQGGRAGLWRGGLAHGRWQHAADDHSPAWADVTRCRQGSTYWSGHSQSITYQH
ncbi:MAG: bifunctional 4-hydroxy-2-oxoglutarate aldolase/2-dehydro-3-deoxy-phosphogluconate aldolase [Anaerolineae bacterium]